jgi:hypothetical protein
MALGIFLALSLSTVGLVLANGGPFVLKYPKGDPAAKGVLARLDPDLKPGRETRLRVVKEDLKISFEKDRGWGDKVETPLVRVSAEYTIENPTEEEIEVDFGFPILRGIYLNPMAMMPSPDVRVRMNKEYVRANMISNSAIYGIIRQRARKTIDKAVAADAALAGLVAAVRKAGEAEREAARNALAAHLTGPMKWNDRNAALMVEYAGLDFGEAKGRPPDRTHYWHRDTELQELMNANLGPLAAIGEQKATQFFGQLASRFDPTAAAAYEAIFTAWGGDVRERSVDLKTGKVRPREITVDPKALKNTPSATRGSDPTVYARVDYLDPNAKISEAEKASCKAVLKNLPVVFTFAPMNLLHYSVKFPAKATQTLTVTYSQYAYADTRGPSSYQLAYVVHPASMWQEFGPINLEIAVPEGVSFKASVPVQTSDPDIEERPFPTAARKVRYAIHRTTLSDKKTGEIFVAVDATAWKSIANGKAAESHATKTQ